MTHWFRAHKKGQVKVAKKNKDESDNTEEATTSAMAASVATAVKAAAAATAATAATTSTTTSAEIEESSDPSTAATMTVSQAEPEPEAADHLPEGGAKEPPFEFSEIIILQVWSLSTRLHRVTGCSTAVEQTL